MDYVSTLLTPLKITKIFTNSPASKSALEIKLDYIIGYSRNPFGVFSTLEDLGDYVMHCHNNGT